MFNILGNSLLSLSANLPLAMTPRIYYAIPLVVAISLVYGATRHEHLMEIFAEACRSALWVVGFMALIFALIWIVGFWN